MIIDMLVLAILFIIMWITGKLIFRTGKIEEKHTILINQIKSLHMTFDSENREMARVICEMLLDTKHSKSYKGYLEYFLRYYSKFHI